MATCGKPSSAMWGKWEEGDSQFRCLGCSWESSSWHFKLKLWINFLRIMHLRVNFYSGITGVLVWNQGFMMGSTICQSTSVRTEVHPILHEWKHNFWAFYFKSKEDTCPKRRGQIQSSMFVNIVLILCGQILLPQTSHRLGVPSSDGSQRNRSICCATIFSCDYSETQKGIGLAPCHLDKSELVRKKQNCKKKKKKRKDFSFPIKKFHKKRKH